MNAFLTILIGGSFMAILTAGFVLAWTVEWYGLHRDRIDTIRSESFREFVKKEVNGCRLS